MLQLGRAPASLAILLMSVLVGCGGEDEEEPSSEAPLAQLVPQDAAIYLEASVRPEGEELEAIEDIAARFPEGDDLGDRLVEELDEDFEDDRESEDEEVTWDEDVSPWLGERAAFVFTELSPRDGGEDATPSFVAEVTDTEAAADALPALAALDTEDVEEHEEDGLRYYVDDEGETGGLIADHMVAAPTEEDFLALARIAEGDEPSLADAEGFSYSVGEVDGAVAPAFALVDPQAILRSIEVNAPGIGESSDLAAVRTDTAPVAARTKGASKPFSLALEVAPDEVVIHSSAVMEGDSEREAEEASELLESLPADSFAATSCPGCIEGFRAGFEAGLGEAAREQGIDPDQIDDVIRERLGLDPDAFTKALGPLAVFARGGNPLSLAGALVVEVEDRAEIERGIEGVRDILSTQLEVEVSDLPPGLPEDASGFSVASPGVPVGLNVVVTDERLVLAVGEDATVDAFETEESLGDSEEFQAEVEALGADYVPQLFADFDQIADLAGFASSDAQSYLDPLQVAVAGARVEGDRSIGRLSVKFDSEDG